MLAAMSRLTGLRKLSQRLSTISGQPVMRHRKLKVIGVTAASFYRDNLVRIVIDVSDSVKNRQWIRKFKAHWKTRLEQLELWVVSYPIEIE